MNEPQIGLQRRPQCFVYQKQFSVYSSSYKLQKITLKSELSAQNTFAEASLSLASREIIVIVRQRITAKLHCVNIMKFDVTNPTPNVEGMKSHEIKSWIYVGSSPVLMISGRVFSQRKAFNLHFGSSSFESRLFIAHHNHVPPPNAVIYPTRHD